MLYTFFFFFLPVSHVEAEERTHVDHFPLVISRESVVHGVAVISEASISSPFRRAARVKH